MTGYKSLLDTAQKEFDALIEAMKKETTAEEWKIISPYQLTRYYPRKLTYGQPTGRD